MDIPNTEYATKSTHIFNFDGKSVECACGKGIILVRPVNSMLCTQYRRPSGLIPP